jgi:hypothetical protein
MMFPALGNWFGVPDGDPRALALYLRHYSARHYRDGRKRTLFVGPGEKMVLLSGGCDALFIWRKFISDDEQEGVSCSLFRNESPITSSLLIQEAVAFAWQRWAHERLFTYVNPSKIASVNPGYCFKKAGWRIAGHSKRGLIILELSPNVTLG